MTIVSTGDRAAAWPLVHFPSPLQPFAQLLLPGRHWVLEDLMGSSRLQANETPPGWILCKDGVLDQGEAGTILFWRCTPQVRVGSAAGSGAWSQKVWWTEARTDTKHSAQEGMGMWEGMQGRPTRPPREAEGSPPIWTLLPPLKGLHRPSSLQGGLPQPQNLTHTWAPHHQCSAGSTLPWVTTLAHP